MSQDLRNFLIGVAATFLVLILVSFFIFGGVFMYHLGKTNTTNEVVFVAEKAKDIAVNAQNTADKAITIALEANDNSEKAIAVATDAKSFTEKIATTKPEVKVVYVKPPVAPRDPQDQVIIMENAITKVLAPTKDAIENLSKDVNALKDGQARIEKTQGEHGERLGNLENRMTYIETDVNKITDPSDRTRRMIKGEKGYIEFKEKQQKDCSDVSKNPVK